MLQRIYELEDKEYANQFEFLKEALELDPFLNSPVRTLFLGHRMCADFAAALLHRPDVLYLDESTIGVDIVVKDRSREAVKLINAESSTTVTCHP
jgi:ABC-2 type transport system ATP-binding protein